MPEHEQRTTNHPPRPADDRGSQGRTPTDRRRLRHAWADHLEQYEWAHFVTLTTRLSTTALGLRREFDDGYIRRLARMAQGPVPWFWVVEHGSTGIAHAHALLAGTAALRIDQLREVWRLGFTHAEVYDPRRGAAFYLTKELGAGEAWGRPREPEYDVSRREPPRRTPKAA